MASHSIINPGPEKSKYDESRHQSMRLRSNGMMGIPKVFVNGTKPPRPICRTCDRLVSICETFGCAK